MKILIVEDNPTDRQLLLYILEAKFQHEAKFREASSIEKALQYLQRGDIECIILDLSLPDSTGKETFDKLYNKYSHIPIIVMTNNQNRDLALKMTQAGAADYILKDFTNEEEIFRRILYAFEKNKTSVRIDPEGAKKINTLVQSKAQMMTAHSSGQHQIAQTLNIQTTSNLTDISKHLFTEIQRISLENVKLNATVESIKEDVEELKNKFDGKNSLSIPTQIHLIEHRLKEVEKDNDKLENKFEKTTTEVKKNLEEEEKEFKKKVGFFNSNKTTIIVTIIATIGTLGGAYFAYKAQVEKPQKTMVEPKDMESLMKR